MTEVPLDEGQLFSNLPHSVSLLAADLVLSTGMCVFSEMLEQDDTEDM